MDVDENTQKIINAIENGENVILHGPGGCGKSYSIKIIAEYFLNKGKNVCCVATTGIAAINLCVPEKKIQATTLHSWSGIGMGKGLASRLLAKVSHDPYAKERWMNTQILILDEVSMLGADLLDNLDYIGQAIRNSKKPFGGLQIVFSGDFLQLPPVKDEWVFKSLVWGRIHFHPFIFNTPKRYDDNEYFQLLLRVRDGVITPDDEKKLKARVKAYQKFRVLLQDNAQNANIVRPTFIYSKKKDVEQENITELDKLEGETFDFIAEDRFTPLTKKAKIDQYITLLDDSIPKIVSLKKGAQVMLKFNIDVKGGLVNGSRGVITELNQSGVMVRFINGKKLKIGRISWEIEDKDGIAIREQIPFILAWAITIHRCVSGNTFVFTAEDGICPISHVIRKKGWNSLKKNVVNMEGKWEETLHGYMGEEEDSIILTTSKGYELEGSFRHPVLVEENGEKVWKKLPHVKEGDVLFLRTGIGATRARTKKQLIFTYFENFFEKKKTRPILSENFAYFVGMLYGLNYNIVQNTISKTYEEVCKREWEQLFGKNVLLQICEEKLYMGVTPLSEILHPIFYQNDFLTSYIFNHSIFAQRKFLEGYLFYNNNPYGKKEFLIQLQMLCLNIGYIPEITYCPNPSGLKYNKQNYRFHVPGLTYPPQSTMYKDTIVSLRRGRCKMYDFELSQTHSFISNGIISHNSQSSTLDFAVCDLGPSIFCEGQAYVSLSRVRNLKGLFIPNFYRPSIKANKEAIEYSKKLDELSKDYKHTSVSSSSEEESNSDEDFDNIFCE